MKAHHSNKRQFCPVSAYVPGTHFTPEYGEDVERAFLRWLRLAWLSLGFVPRSSKIYF